NWKKTKGKICELAERLTSVESQLDFLEDTDKEWKANPPAARENRGRRNNLRIVGFPEACEGRDAAGFLATVLPEILEMEFSGSIEIEQSHRSAAQPHPDGRPPRHFIVCFLRHTDKERIRNTARDKGRVTWKGHHIMFFPDYSNAVEDKRRCFNQCKKMLHEQRIKFSLTFPAKLDFYTKNGGRVRFDNHAKAMAYIKNL
uniref:L1 transposable element RRM domain-containing protein n=1 Tax=Labrus bergylta TaxID=56723 RepID=A0A3Q3H0Y4_9LABR